MRKLFTFLAALILTSNVFAQSPEKMSYQTVIRDASNNLLSNQSVGMQISILQGSASGTAVYVERHFPTTNTNGLVSMEIGNGTIVNGDFSAIDWADGPYFIKTETDLKGGANYTITGTSQLLSVPYALYAKTVTETDPVFNAWDKNYNDLTNTPENATSTTDGFMSAADKIKLNDLENINITAGTGISVSGTFPNLTISTTSPTYRIGLNEDLGGYVFYVTPDGKHGLVAATKNQNIKRCTWYNAQDIISNPANHNISGAKFTDWRLPTKYELNLIYDQKDDIGGFTADNYWSSTESDFENAWLQDFNDGTQIKGSKRNEILVRAVRAF